MHKPLRLALLVAAIHSGGVLAQAKALDIPAQPLAGALTALASQSGIQLLFNADELKGARASALHGNLSPEAALRQLLEGSGFSFASTGKGTFVVQKRAAASGERELPEVLVTAAAMPLSAGEEHLDRRVIEALPRGNGDITSLLKIHPNVQFDSKVLQSAKGGEIAPADISINGAKFYQNSYMLDGMGISNHLDPATKTENMPHMLSGSAFGMNIDSSLVCDIVVRDANVPVEFGGFTGGVVEAKTCEPKRAFGGQLSYQTTRSSWMHAYVDERYKDAYQNSSDSFLGQPKFTKQSWRLALEGKPTENSGLIGSFVQTESSIPLQSYQGGGAASPQNNLTETRKLENFFVRGFWHPVSDIDLDMSLTYAPGEDRRYMNTWQNSGWTNRTGGMGANLGMAWRLDKGTLTQRVSWTEVEGSRGNEDATSSKWWLASPEKNWAAAGSNAVEGGRGPQNQRERTATYFGKFDWNALQLGNFRHQFQAGLELSKTEAYYERESSFSYYEKPKDTNSCIGPDGVADFTTCSLSAPYNQPTWSGQFLSQRATYRAGRIEAEGYRRALFMQDEIQRGDVRLRLGLRYQNDDLSTKSGLAPRLAAFWDVFGDKRTQFEAGLNRYYSYPLFAYQLTAGRRGLLYYETRASMASPWVYSSNVFDRDRARPLENPYDDEAMLSLRQQWGGFSWTAKWVNRKGRKQVATQTVTDPGGSGNLLYYFSNDGKSDADTLSLTVTNTTPWKFAGTSTEAMFVLDQTQVTASHLSYGETLDSNGLARMIRYNGTVMPWSDKPVDNYIRPWTARLLLNTEIPAARVRIGNFLRYRAGYDQVVSVGSYSYNGSNITDYAKRHFGGAMVWDLSATWSIPTGIAKQEAYTTVSINNVLDRKVAMYDNGTSLGGLYEYGRQFWLEIGYRF